MQLKISTDSFTNVAGAIHLSHTQAVTESFGNPMAKELYVTFLRKY
jgi:hypothetical protein